MESVSGVTGTKSTATASSALTGVSQVSQQDFLNLLVTQLKNQDPLNPQDPIEFTSQLTQFSQLEQLLNINKALAAVEAGQKTIAHGQATDYIGKSVKASGNGVEVVNGQSTPITYHLASNAATVDIQIRDASGQVVRTIQQSLVNAGDQSVAFDGKDNLGQPLPDGTYEITVNALDAVGNSVETQVFKTGIVTGVDLQGEEPTLLINGQKVKLSDILEVTAVSGA